MIMRLLLTGILLAAGALFLLNGISFLIDPVSAGASLSVGGTDLTGWGAIRGDMAAFFIVGAVCMIWGAWRRTGDILLVPAALFGIALLGRIISLIAIGGEDGFWIPMVVEAAMLIVTLFASRVLPHREPSVL